MDSVEMRLIDVASASPSFVYQHAGAILSIPENMQPREIIIVLRELERLALDDYLRRTSDAGGT